MAIAGSAKIVKAKAKAEALVQIPKIAPKWPVYETPNRGHVREFINSILSEKYLENQFNPLLFELVKIFIDKLVNRSAFYSKWWNNPELRFATESYNIKTEKTFYNDILFFFDEFLRHERSKNFFTKNINNTLIQEEKNDYYKFFKIQSGIYIYLNSFKS
jgi:hypothetical protein